MTGMIFCGSRVRCANNMIVDTTSRSWREKKIREWLLLLLRFAVTREREDRAAAQSFAEELDGIGASRRLARPSFFQRTNNEICDAIQTVENPKRAAILRRHIARIPEQRLRRAFSAALGLTKAEVQPPARGKTIDLWKGLAG